MNRHRWDDLYREWKYGMRDHLVQYSYRENRFVRCEVAKLAVVL